MRNLKRMQNAAPNETYAKVINASAESLWHKKDWTDANGLGWIGLALWTLQRSMRRRIARRWMRWSRLYGG
jgi:hypothetical protein